VRIRAIHERIGLNLGNQKEEKETETERMRLGTSVILVGKLDFGLSRFDGRTLGLRHQLTAYVAQWIAHQTSNLGVAGSSPAMGFTPF
jgi:hypothetical protein